MLIVIIGFIILSFGLFYIPIKEAELTILKSKTPRWFTFLVGAWALTTMAYIPFICNIFLEGLVRSGYLIYSAGEGAFYFLSISSMILYVIGFKTYTSRLETQKEKLIQENSNVL
ncbi:hypothetical protein [uncultured Metabacillus sp.]|uniref:hypothetical protein n=1 Tax=uncultured Metabacillus sp. TaxID=2860135 RepID=UPI00262E018E|nr:hypothetical protein [uncultured Metabacillus sp.]